MDIAHVARVSIGHLWESGVLLRRFPIPLALCVLLAIDLNMRLAGFDEYSGRFDRPHVLDFALGGFLATLAAHLWALQRGWGALSSAMLALVALAIVGLLVSLSGTLATALELLVIALIPAPFIAPYLRPVDDLTTFWRFSMRMGAAIAAGVVALLIVALGVSACVTSLELLFGIGFDSRIYGHIWLISSTIVGPVVALILVPAHFDKGFTASAEGRLLERFALIMCTYALAPVFVIYALVLHLYAASVLIRWSLPEAQIGWIVTGFAAISVTAFFLGYPWRGSGRVVVEWLLRNWAWFLIVPLILMGAAVAIRIGQNGVTPPRYLLVLVTLWMTFTVAYVLARHGRADIRVPPVSLCVLLLLASFGPWGAYATTGASQSRILEELLRDRGAVVDGRLVASEMRPDWTDHQLFRISSMFAELNQANQLHRIVRLLPDEKRTDYEAADELQRRNILRRAIGLPVVEHVERPMRTLIVTDAVATAYSVSGYGTLFGPLHFTGQNRMTAQDRIIETAVVHDGLTITYSGGVLSFSDQEETIATFDVNALVDELYVEDLDPMTESAMREGPVLQVVKPGRLALLFTELHGEMEDGEGAARGGKFWLLTGE